MNLLKGDSKTKNLIALDIGSYFIKSLIYQIQEKENRAILISWTKEELKISENNLTSPEIKEKIEKIIEKTEKKAGIKATHILWNLPSSIIKTKGQTFCHQRSNPDLKIDIPEMKNIIQKTQWKAFEEIKKEFSKETGHHETKAKIVTSILTKTSVDENKIENPVGFKGKKLCISVLNNYTHIDWLNQINKISNNLNLELYGLTSSSLTIFNSIDFKKKEKNLLIIDMGGKTTEVTLIKNQGETAETKTFNLGGFSFTRILAEFLELDINQAETIKKKYSKSKISPKAKSKIEKTLKPSIISWAEGIRITLKDFKKKHNTSPKTIFLCGQATKLPGIREILEEKGNFKIQTIEGRDITKVKNKTKLKQ
ncbi:MAG: hypothetical protein GF387_02185, partial [Candidatus Portnoybacteria bacterium]|nr:hypothetical protein [Candidatus Portnoybacteria bacterium]